MLAEERARPPAPPELRLRVATELAQRAVLRALSRLEARLEPPPRAVKPELYLIAATRAAPAQVELRAQRVREAKAEAPPVSTPPMHPILAGPPPLRAEPVRFSAQAVARARPAGSFARAHKFARARASCAQ